MTRIHRTAARLVVIAVLASACAASVSTSPAPASAVPSAISTPTPAPSLATAAASQTAANPHIADLAYLVERLKAIHPKPFLDEGEAAFMTRVAAIEAASATMTDSDFLAAVMDLMGHRERDGHSGAWAFAQPNALLSAWPVWLWDFPDGLRVVAARAPHEDLIGARLTKVGHMAVADARAAVDPLVPRDNNSNLRANLPTYLLLPTVLTRLGVLAPRDPGLTLELTDGTTREVTPEPLPIESYRDWIFGVYGGLYPESLPPDADGPLYQRHRDLAFWSELQAKDKALYVGYNAVARTNSQGRSIGDLATSILKATEADPNLSVVIDLRNNGGGDNTTFSQLRSAVETVALDRPGRVSLITGRSTFSAAGNFVTDLMVGRAKAGIRLVGEAPGGGLNIHGDVDVVTLPASGIVVLISGDYHRRAPGDDRLAIEPTIPVEVTWADYIAGRDPVLAAALKH